ncbi:MAG: hypothetical protein IPL61_05120 [Myxococcales bacterium]|nr:hypothetical protein [Myxococcales bacterium]
MRDAQAILFALFLGAPLVACGGGALSPGVGDDPGTGSVTLLVDAEVNARPILTNARDGQDFTTEFHVQIEKAGTTVTTGSVIVRSSEGEVALVYGGDSNRWNGAQVGYWEVYELDVTSGSDFVEGVRVDGPALHSFTAPQAGATVDALVPLQVDWKRGEAADAASIETEQIDSLSIADTGSFMLPAGSLKSTSSQVEQERIRVERSQRVTPTGAVGGSQMRVEIRNEIEILVQATGL